MKQLSNYQKLVIVQVFTCLLIIGLMFYFNYQRPVKYTTDPSVSQEIRKSNAEFRAALEMQFIEQTKTAEYNRKRDSANDAKLSENTSKIEKTINASNEKISNINRYNSLDIIRAFSNLDK